MNTTSKLSRISETNKMLRQEDKQSDTNIMNGCFQSHESPTKYQITPEGQIYRVETDGSVIYLGNADKINASNENLSYESSKDQSPQFTLQKSSRKRLWVCCGIIFLLLISSGVLYYINTPRTVEKPSTPNTDLVHTEVNSSGDNDITFTVAEEVEISNKQDLKKEESATEPVLIQKTEKKEKSEVIKVEKTYIENPNPVEQQTKTEIITSNSIDPNKIYSYVDVQAEFPGGDKARLQWLRDNISWPRDANGHLHHGDVELDFVVERDGSVSNVKVSSSDNPELNSAAIRLISSMPKWAPAQVNNQPVRSPLSITLLF